MYRIQGQASDLFALTRQHEPPTTTKSPGSSAIEKTGQSGTELAPLTTSPIPSTRRPGLHTKMPRTNTRRGSEIAVSTYSTSSWRKKRSPYITIACNECRRRKIRCIGQNPCERCNRLSLPCLYDPSSRLRLLEEYNRLKRPSAQDTLQQSEISGSIEANHEGPGVSIDYHGPQSPTLPQTMHLVDETLLLSTEPFLQQDFSYDDMVPNIDNSSVLTNGLNDLDSVLTTTELQNAYADTYFTTERSGVYVQERQADPLFEIENAELIRLCLLYKKAVGFMYPVVDIQSLITHLENLASPISSEEQITQVRADNVETLQLRVIICCAMMIEKRGHNEQVDRIHQSLRSVADQIPTYDATTSRNLPNILVLLAIYHLISQNDNLAHQTIWQLARLCLGRDLHRSKSLSELRGVNEQDYTLNTFWAAYVLERQSEYNTGLPCVIKEEDIDKELPLPKAFTYLKAIVDYTRLGNTIHRGWYSLASQIAPDLALETLDTLDKDILRWYVDLPEELRVTRPQREGPVLTEQIDDSERPKTSICLKMLQMRMWLYASVLSCRESATLNKQQSHHALSLAKDTFRYLDSLKDVDLDKLTKHFYDRFLLSTIIVFFLISVHAPDLFDRQCRQDFYATIELVKPVYAESWLSDRLWRVIESLQSIASRFGFRFHEGRSTKIKSTADVLEVCLQSDVGSAGSEIEVRTLSTPSERLGDRQDFGETPNGIRLWVELLSVLEMYTSETETCFTPRHERYMTENVFVCGHIREGDKTIFLALKDLLQQGSSGL